ncbi:MAG: hypothetical protein EXR86_11110 [Gammaproteobacteria bacterium]|nr:hypothetical protein [Gammaproteobacteria bacterium]
MAPVHRRLTRALFAWSFALVVTESAAEGDSTTGPGFATCASYFFLAARGHGVRDYDRLYSSGEHSLNVAAQRHGKDAATTKMEAASNTMMAEMHQDWREIAVLDSRYADACDTLLRDTGFHYD